MIRYVTLGSNDIARSRRFYDAVMKSLGCTLTSESDDELGYGKPPRQGEEPRSDFWVVRPYLKLPANWGNGTMIAFEAENRAIVDAFHAAGMAHSGSDEGAPGLRPYSANFYAAYLRDPDGNKLSAVCSKPA